MQKDMYVAKTDPKNEDMVNNPSHYQAGDLSCIDIMLKLYGKDIIQNLFKNNKQELSTLVNHIENEIYFRKKRGQEMLNIFYGDMKMAKVN